MIFYHPGKPGEVSHERAKSEVIQILSNPFTSSRMLYRTSDHTWMRSRKSICAPGAMHAYLMSTALRELTQGEGGETPANYHRWIFMSEL